MRILQIYELNPFMSIGGVETSILHLSRELLRLGHEVNILTGAGGVNGSPHSDGPGVIQLDFFKTMMQSYSSGCLTLQRQLLFMASLFARNPKLEYDVYHGHIYSSGLLAKRLAEKNGGISVNTIHGSYYPVWNLLKNPISASFYKNAEKRLATHLAKNADLQIHVSSYFADQVSGWGANGRVKVIPNGVDTKLFNPKVPSTIESREPVILTARRLVRKNGVEYLIKAVNELEGKFRLIIVGDGPERKKLIALARDSSYIDFIGSVPHEKMPGLIAGADVTVIPSLIEASSLFMLEAMAMEKPVVATSVGGIPETLGESGLLVPSMDVKQLSAGLFALLDDPKKARRFGRSARKRVEEKYTWEKIAKQIETEYQLLWSEQNA